MTDVSSPRKRLALAACGLLLIAFAIIAWSAWRQKSAAFDEPFHFTSAWLQTHYGDFRCNSEDPPLWKYYVAAGTSKNDLPMDEQTPLWNRMLDSIPAASVLYSVKVLYQTPGIDADKLLRAARVRMVLIGVALGAAIAWWGWRLRGPLAAVVATAAFCLDPNFLAHSPIVKNDVPITLVFLLLMAAVWLLGERATLLRCAAVMLLVGVCPDHEILGPACLPHACHSPGLPKRDGSAMAAPEMDPHDPQPAVFRIARPPGGLGPVRIFLYLGLLRIPFRSQSRSQGEL